MIFGIIALIVIVLIVLWGVSAYNGLVTLRNRVKNGWAQIDVQLKQRADLIPNLVETVKGYAAHESQVFTQVTQARASALQAAQSGDVAQRIQAENQLSRAIMNLQAVAEAYPQLQANQNFLDLQAQLKALEEKIAYARQFYNDVVQKYNTKIEVVPTNIIAGLFHFEQAAYFQVDEADRHHRRKLAGARHPANHHGARRQLRESGRVLERKLHCRFAHSFTSFLALAASSSCLAASS